LLAHILVHFIQEPLKEKEIPTFPFLCLLVSGGHTQLVVMKSQLEMEIIGQTIDDAAGEAFDKCAKVIGLPYPGGPVIDKLAREGESVFSFNKPRIDELDFSFSGLKTSFLYFLRDNLNYNPSFVDDNKSNLCASLQQAIIDILLEKLVKASKITGIDQIAIAGGVAANSGLRNALQHEASRRNWNVFIPELRFTTDNAAMVAITGYYKYLRSEFTTLDIAPFARMT
jgi:N6-L-threonylcarbamoyladenine synthase